MSELLAFLAAIPSPTPQIIEKVTQLQPIVQQVPATPPEVTTLAQLLAVGAAGILTSFIHQAATRGRLSSNLNRLLFAVYGLLAGVATAFLTGELKWDSEGLIAGLTGLSMFLTSSQGRYEASKWLSSLMAPSESPAPAPSPAELPVAAEEAASV